MRTHFFNYLSELAEKDKDIIFITGDLGYSYFEKFEKKFPDQFINCGCMEQSMINIAVGLALAGKKPYVYSTIPFLLFRPLEMVRNNIVQMKNNVKLFGVAHSGFLGFSHNMINPNEDINVCRNIGLKYFIPNSPEKFREFLLDNKYKSYYARI